MTEPDDRNPAPTSVAVALGYRRESDPAPRIVASGRGAVAEQIIRIALENDVKLREDADLASVLAAIEVESPIPIEAFAAVAEILSYLYRANGMREAEVAASDWRQP